jgi:16S rRNA (uracil1498-N3)-methyltransferase
VLSSYVLIMALHRFYCNPIVEPMTELTGREAHHLAGVLRLGPGDEVELFDGAGTLAVAAISTIKKAKVTLQIEQLQHHQPRSCRRIVIAVSIAKGQRFDWLIEKCTEFAVDRISPVIFERTIKQATNPRTTDRWNNLAISAAKQCGRLFLPKIDSPRPLPDTIKLLRAEYPQVRLLSGGLSADTPSLIGQSFGRADVTVFIGPEGGLTEDEINLLKDSGAQPVRLTDTVLRIETAATAFASILTAQRDAEAG